MQLFAPPVSKWQSSGGTNLMGIIHFIYEKFVIENLEIELSNSTAREKNNPLFSLSGESYSNSSEAELAKMVTTRIA